MRRFVNIYSTWRMPLLEIVRAVGEEYMAKKASKNEMKGSRLIAIKLGAQGDTSALG